MNSDRRIVLSGLLLLLAGAAALQPFALRSVADFQDAPWVLAGGYRPLAADWLWLQADLAWERHDARETRRLIGLTVAAEPGALYFWLNGARMLAYDLPTWTDDAASGVTAGLRVYRRKLAAGEALRLLERGRRWHPQSVALEVEMGNICLYALGDQAQAARHFRRAALQPEAPAYAGRISRRLLEHRP